MSKTIQNLLKSELFSDFSPGEISAFLNEYGYFERSYRKGEEIYGPGDTIKNTGIILSGQINVVQISSVGREGIVVSEFPGELIGQAFSITGQHNSFAYFIATVDTDILYLDIRSILSSPGKNPYHIKFINNITRILAGTNIQLNKKIQLLTQKTLREKLMTFFTQTAASTNSTSFKINFNREQLASYVCAERSSVCRELGRMQDEGMIIMDGNNVTLCHPPEL
ncbi:MAG: Crp/Fnr family transcriptional regulator [Lachnospiraceae bacterium]|nr:Crp/Fnr family transcriptional regulator [Lachnospiraceae bacterium]